MKSKKLKDLLVLIDQQARQIVTLEKKLYDTRDKLNKEVRGLQSLEHLTEKILGTAFDVEKITNSIVEYLIYEREMEKALLFISQKEEGVLKLQAARGYKEEKIKALKGMDFQIEELLEEIVKKKKTKIFDIKPKGARQPLIKKLIESLEISYFLAAALVGRKEKIIGILIGGYSREKALRVLPQFTDVDIVLFSALVGHSSSLIENAYINIELQRKIKELEEFRMITVGRELKMVELKEKAAGLKKELEILKKELKNKGRN